MSYRSLNFVLILLAALVVSGVVGVLGTLGVSFLINANNTETIEKTEYHDPPPDPWQELTDDRLEDKNPKFDPTLVDSRPLEAWLVNASAAVIRLNVVAAKPDQDATLLHLYPSYTAAVKAGRGQSLVAILPSVNLIDGKAKQFDDGLYAALDQAYYLGLEGKLRSHVRLVRALFDKVGPQSPAAPFLAAALELAGEKADVADTAAKAQFLQDFNANEVLSKPIGFYTWSEPLQRCFRFMRFGQWMFGERSLQIPVILAQVLAGDPALLADYRKSVEFFNKLTNPAACLSLADIVAMKTPDPAAFARLCQERKLPRDAVAIFPPSTARETVLFEKLFGSGLPPSADLMRELIKRIRSGEVNLQPDRDSGWYEHQVYALETMLLPEKGEEKDKLLLTKEYKKRMLEAFQVLITKRRETHIRQMMMAMAGNAASPSPSGVKPRLRLEPCPSYYLRTARAYGFLTNFLEATVTVDGLKALHGLKQDGQRQPDLHTELLGQRDLFYGLYLVSCEDLGLKADLKPDEPVDQDPCYKRANDWLAKAFDDPDLAVDTRVSVPIMIDVERRVTRLWTTLGVRLAKLDASYAKPPRIKPADDKDAEWKEADPSLIQTAHYLLPVEDFAEVELRGLRTLTREELRAACDQHKTKEAIVAALSQRP